MTNNSSPEDETRFHGFLFSSYVYLVFSYSFFSSSRPVLCFGRWNCSLIFNFRYFAYLLFYFSFFSFSRNHLCFDWKYDLWFYYFLFSHLLVVIFHVFIDFIFHFIVSGFFFLVYQDLFYFLIASFAALFSLTHPLSVAFIFNFLRRLSISRPRPPLKTLGSGVRDKRLKLKPSDQGWAKWAKRRDSDEGREGWNENRKEQWRWNSGGRKIPPVSAALSCLSAASPWPPLS